MLLNGKSATGTFLSLMVVAAIIVDSGSGGVSPLTQLGGLSLMKRAILTAQKAGAKTCYLSVAHEQAVLEREFANDPRITSQLVWLSAQPTAAVSLDTQETHNECLLVPLETIFRHPTIHALTRYSLGRAVIVQDARRKPMLALVPHAALASTLTELQEGTPWHAISTLHTATSIYPPSGQNLFLRQLSISTPIATIEHDLLLSLENPRDGQVDTYFNRKVSRPITRWLVRTALTPNQVTVLSCLVGILGALCFFLAGYWGPVLGALLLQFSVVLDCCDGEIARVKFMESPFGDSLDIICDTIVSVAIFLGIGGAVWHNGESHHAVLLAGILALGGLLAFPFVTLAEKTETAVESCPSWENHTIKKLLSSLTTRDFSVIIVASAIAGQLSWFLWGAAFGAHVFWLFLAWLLHRSGRLRAFHLLWQKENT